MRIAFITPSLNQGGYEKIVISYANELSARGHKVDLLCGHLEGELLETVGKNIRLINFNARARSFFFPLVKYLRENRIDILYSAFRFYNCVSVVAKVVSKSKVTIYATQHGFEAEKQLIKWIEGRIISKADYLITVAEDIANYESKELRIDRRRFIVLDNPVLDKRIRIEMAEHPWFIEKDIPIVAVEGRLAEGKGVNYCIEILKEMNSYKKIRMMVLGDGPLKETLKQQAKQLDVADNITFLGYVKSPISYLMGCNVFLHTSLSEGFGNVVVEAMYAGLPPCVSDCSGPLQIIKNGEFGMNLGDPRQPDFCKTAAKQILTVIDGKITYPGIRSRALDFEVQRSTDKFLAVKEGTK